MKDISTRFLLETFIILKFLVNATESDFHKSLFITKLCGKDGELIQWGSSYQERGGKKQSYTVAGRSSLDAFTALADTTHWFEQPLIFSFCS